ncbi:hypothetical protein KL921_005440, partial [Ogataea angusta]
MFISAGFTGH